MVLTVAGAAQANQEINDGLFWGCKLQDVVVYKGKTFQVPVVGLLYSTKFSGYGELSCLSVLKNQIARTPVHVELKSKGIGVGTAFPQEMGLVSVGVGLKVNSPEDLFGEYSSGAKLQGTFFKVSGGLGVKFQHPAGGPAMDVAFLGEKAIGLKVGFDVFKLKVMPAGETTIQYLNQ